MKIERNITLSETELVCSEADTEYFGEWDLEVDGVHYTVNINE